LQTAQGTSPEYLEAIDKLGRLYLVQRRLGEAEPLLERAVDLSEKVQGASPESRAAAFVDLGDFHHALSQEQGSQPAWDRLATIDYFRAVVLLDSSSSLAWASATIKFAGTFRFKDPSKPAPQLVSYLDGLLTKALALAEAAKGPVSSTSELGMVQLLRIHQGSKDPSWQNRFCKADSSPSGRLLLACASSFLGRSDPAQASRLASDALNIFEHQPEGAVVTERVEALLVIAEAKRKLGQLNEAEKVTSQALDSCEQYLGASHWLREDTLTARAGVLEELKRKAEAKQARQKAAAIASANKRGTATPRLTNLKLRQRVEPSYTAEARSNKVEGAIMMLCEISVDGHARVLAAFNRLGYGLDEEAVASILRWHFDPVLKDNHPVPSAATIEVNFKLI
jgi:tetratricopeptide (TPR) repeat protein